MDPSPFQLQSEIETSPKPPSLTEEEILALFDALRREARLHRIRQRRNILLIGIAFLGIAYAYFAESLLLFTAAGLILMCVSLSRLRLHQRAAVQKLSELEDIRAIGPLVDSFAFTDLPTQAIVRKALVRLLPQFKASDAARLNSSQRTVLWRLLTEGDQPLILAILKAYHQIGNEQDISAVESLVFDKGQPLTIRNAARECLPFLRSRSEQAVTRKTLLRPSEEPSSPPVELLRPAAPEATTDPDQLLRPTDGRRQ